MRVCIDEDMQFECTDSNVTELLNNFNIRYHLEDSTVTILSQKIDLEYSDMEDMLDIFADQSVVLERYCYGRYTLVLK